MIPVKKYKNINITLWRIPEKNIEPLKILNDKLNPLYFSNLESKIKTYYKKYPLKPHGLWYSCGVSWYNFCLDNEFGDWCVYKDCNVYQLEIDKSKILSINTIPKLKNFHNKYKETKNKITKNKITKNKITKTNHEYIKWNEVYKEYYGIHFCPFLKTKFRKETNYMQSKLLWYLSIDVDSGCIWNINAIKNFKNIGYIPNNPTDTEKKQKELSKYLINILDKQLIKQETNKNKTKKKLKLIKKN